MSRRVLSAIVMILCSAQICFAAPAVVWKTGQTVGYATGDDGNLRPGIAWPGARFTGNGNGTVTDNLTGLIWLKDADCFGTKSWTNALSSANGLASGSCGLSDGSSAGDWRLPNREELYSLVDFAFYAPAVSNAAGTAKWSAGDPFTNVQSSYYWSSTTYAAETPYAWYVYMSWGYVGDNNPKSNPYYVWPVRAGGLFGNPGISASPDSKDFGTVNPGSSSSAETFTITNTGTNNLYINTITITGTNADQFGIVDGADNCSGQTIAPSGTCTVQTVFSPTAGGSKSSSLSIPSNASGSPTGINLSGTAPQHTITTSVSGSGTVSCSPTPVGHGLTSLCTVTPDTGHHITSISGCGGTDPGIKANEEPFEYGTGPVTADCGVTAAFGISTYHAISATISEGSGTFSCEPSNVEHGGSFQCSVIPDWGYHLQSLVDNGGDVKGSVANETYSFANVIANHEITATFQQNTVVLRLSGAPPESWYSLIQDAYNASSDTHTDHILTQALDFNENLDFNREGISIILKGGYDADFNLVTGVTIIHGSLTVRNGTLIVGSLIIQ
jgi:hypothetical protein